jgi:hypothetical protein
LGNTTADAFPVHIDKGQFVGDLTEAIKAKKAPEFDNFPADKFKLWKKEIRDDQDDLLSTRRTRTPCNKKDFEIFP